jgi:hypothetical protein
MIMHHRSIYSSYNYTSLYYNLSYMRKNFTKSCIPLLTNYKLVCVRHFFAWSYISYEASYVAIFVHERTFLMCLLTGMVWQIKLVWLIN